MEVLTQQQVPVGAASSLARFLRENPEPSWPSPDVLARQFGLKEEFVLEVLSSLRSGRSEPSPQSSLGESLRSVGERLLAVFRSATKEPGLFLAVSTILAFLLGHLIGRTVGGQAAVINNAVIAVVALILHALCYYRHGLARLVATGALWVWIGIGVSFIRPIRFSEVPASQRGQIVAILLLVATMLTLMYAVGALIFSVLGGYRRLRKTEGALEKMSRQELLQRLFELRERLANPHKPIPGGFVIPRTMFIAVEKRGWLWATGLAVVVTLMHMLALNIIGYSPTPRVPPPAEWIAVQLVTLAIQILLYFSLAYLSRSAWKGVLNGVLLFVVGSLVYLWDPFHVAGMMSDNPQFFRSPSTYLFNLPFVIVISLVGVMAYRIQEGALRERRLMSQDPAALLAEIVRIEWRLGEGASEVCVVVVDAARSAEMKAGGDPFDAEYSFREYQKMLARIAAQTRGQVHSTAGDGAVIAFRSADDALDAARRIQTEIDAFNRGVNRLATPFRLRIGLHMGEVPGQLNEVQFTHVIDIAAHVQAKAPVGGILMTQAVAARVQNVQVAPLVEPVDGQPVFLALNPTVDA